MKYTAACDCSISTPSLKAKTQNTVAFPAAGYCRRCGKDHGLGPGNSREACNQLMELFEKENRLTLPHKTETTGTNLSLAPLFGQERGKMFGVLECCDALGARRFLYGFSGQFNGQWLVDGWVPPAFDPETFALLNFEEEKRIKALGRKMRCYPEQSLRWCALRDERRTRSRELMTRIHKLYRFTNFRGESRSLPDIFHHAKIRNPPTGTGDCCAPKLLHHAAISGLLPLGISEFFWGRANRSGSRQHGRFYQACSEKCEPILGFLLCGIREC